ncbi:AsnC family transcriptional regulator [Leucobacter rhizosphaerae]|uniref:AsnC family transcriptional regulator n=1 Tax=Leucobacter rhizosphaerae TaxID=2932245 RepID=A0ABY4FZ44_9MICO|nr:AsnC family transcriptional regulator [Leucobacter rhizosphaerae]UOQ61571.1 AsnC family transcriptional regulator [Leucobacter rhizosphaerae]
METATIMAERHTLTAQVLRELRDDGRASYSRIADTVGTTRRQVTEIVEHALAHNLVRVTATISPDLLGKRQFAYLLLAVDQATSVIAELERIQELCFISAITGPFGVDAEIRVGDNQELEERLDRIRQIPGVRRLLVNVYERIAVNIDSPIATADGLYAVDEADLAIAQYLEFDGRASFRTLGSHAGVSAASARNRLRRLISLGAIKVVGLPVRDHHAGAAPVGVGIRVTGSVSSALEALSALGPEFLAATRGNFEIIGTFSGTSNDALLDILEAIRACPEVADVESWSHLRIVREYYGAQAQPPARLS